jgi:PEP-CTERM motif-containing protein
MKRTLFVVAVLVAVATAASAATLSVASDKTTYSVGEAITLTVSGDGLAASTQGIFGRLEMNGSLVNLSNSFVLASNCNPGPAPCANTQKLIGSGFTKGILEAADSNANSANSLTVEAFDQVNFSGGTQTATSPISTITLIAQALGVVNADWNTSTGSGFELSFFGLSNGPGTSFTIVGVPEPSTVALLGFGLVGLVLGGRRRS